MKTILNSWTLLCKSSKIKQNRYPEKLCRDAGAWVLKSVQGKSGTNGHPRLGIILLTNKS